MAVSSHPKGSFCKHNSKHLLTAAIIFAHSEHHRPDKLCLTASDDADGQAEYDVAGIAKEHLIHTQALCNPKSRQDAENALGSLPVRRQVFAIHQHQAWHLLLGICKDSLQHEGALIA